MTIHLYKGDLPAGLDLGRLVAMDTETLGLRLGRDRLCVVQLSSGDGHAHLVQIPKPGPDGAPPQAPNLVKLLTDPQVTKLLHFARFDLAILQRTFGVITAPVYCTKLASRLVRTYTDRHGLKDLVRELLNIELSKQQQSSDWGAPELSADQQAYAAADVAHLHALKAKLDVMLARESRTELAAACFAFLPVRAALDLGGWQDEDIFAH
ncbi:MAG: ribonuclease D [Alphaproteobacteria bacterium]|nr:ribonuclease D [Alphaproteobacteria bacterium]